MAASIELANRHPPAASRPVGLEVSHKAPLYALSASATHYPQGRRDRLRSSARLPLGSLEARMRIKVLIPLCQYLQERVRSFSPRARLGLRRYTTESNEKASQE